MSSEDVPSTDGELEDARDRDRSDLPGSDGEHELQERFETTARAENFYEEAMQAALTDRMTDFLTDRWIGVVGWLDEDQPRATPIIDAPGMVHVLDSETVAWPADTIIGSGPSFDGPEDQRWLSLVTVDWWDSTVGLHVNGVADRVDSVEDGDGNQLPGVDWIVLSVEEAYIHCAKHIPRLSVTQQTPVRAVRDPVQEPYTLLPEAAQRFVGSRLQAFITTAEEAYVHCAKHVPLLSVTQQTPARGVRDPVQKSYTHFPEAAQRFIGSRLQAFLATADDAGETDLSPRIGPAGFVQVLDETTLAWPEYRGNGVHASLGNMLERPQATLLFVDWWSTEVVLEVSGTVSLMDDVDGAEDLTDVDRTKTWVVLDVLSVDLVENPPLPELVVEEFDPPWGTDDVEAKRSGYFTD
ncbi:pyridoxamine 5'-phosphate oxidase family protein [Haloarchaeobius sp. HRN-SO-5]|uniref:pyridoxamine 5'-phosphate oxidase family protein n=1 Tax=Haloarchaeobius sp. HRN-SO-5 TaxID=3446118 RepID=UPI003EBD2C8C